MDKPDNLFDLLFLDGGYATSVSVIFAALMFVLQARQSRLQERRQQTMELLLSMENTDRLCEADRRFACWIKAESGAPNNKRTFENDQVTDEDDHTLIDLLDFYEMVSLSIFEGYLDYKVANHLRGGAMEAAYALCEEYIKARRARLGRPELYGYLEAYCKLRRRSALFRWLGRRVGFPIIRRFV